MPGEPENQTPAPEAPKPEAPQQDYAALQAEFQKTQEQLKQAVSAIAAMQAERQAPQAQPQPEPELTPEFAAQAETFFKRQLAPFLQQMDQRFAQLAGWQGQQQAQQLNQETELPDAIQTEARALMQQYAQAGRPIAYETAVTHVVGNREIARMRQEAANKRAQRQFNSALLPAFGGAGGLPNLQPVNGTARPKDNDIQGWLKAAAENDLPL